MLFQMIHMHCQSKGSKSKKLNQLRISNFDFFAKHLRKQKICTLKKICSKMLKNHPEYHFSQSSSRTPNQTKPKPLTELKQLFLKIKMDNSPTKINIKTVKKIIAVEVYSNREQIRRGKKKREISIADFSLNLISESSMYGEQLQEHCCLQLWSS